MPDILVCAADDHGFSAIGAFQQPGENVRGAVSLFSVAAFDLTLHLPEYILVDDRLMRSFHPKPYVAVIPDSLLIFIGDGSESVVYAVSNVDFVFQDVPYSRQCPIVGFFRWHVFVDIRTHSIPLIQNISRRGHFFLNQLHDDFLSACSMSGKIEYLFPRSIWFLHPQSGDSSAQDQ